jgi:hypothetical protein
MMAMRSGTLSEERFDVFGDAYERIVAAPRGGDLEAQGRTLDG